MLKPSTPVITGIGIASPLGDAQSACAAARAGLTRIQDLALFSVQDDETGEQVPLKGCALTGVTDGLGALARLSVLGSLAITDLVSNLNVANDSLATMPTIVCLSNEVYWRAAHYIDLEETKDDLPFDLDEMLDGEIENRLRTYQEGLLGRIERLSGIKLNNKNVVFSTGDQANFAHVLQQVEENFLSNNVDSCFILTIDSLLEERTFNNALRLNLIKDTNNPIGIIPGEAAIALLVERYDHAVNRKAQPLAAVTACTYLHDELNRFSDGPVTGRILAEVIDAVVVDNENQPLSIDGMIVNLNGDIWRAKEWGAALTRLPDWIRELPIQLVTQYFGETGVTSAPLSVGLAIHRFVRNYAVRDNVLIWVSGDGGGKGAVRVSRIN